MPLPGNWVAKSKELNRVFQQFAKAARTPNAISLDASEKERLLELR